MLTPQQFQRADAVFREACERPAAERREFVERATAGNRPLRDAVLALLRHDAEPRVALESPVAELVRGIGDAWAGGPELAVPERIGSYRVLRQLGAGGFGVVYLAEQENPSRLVAVKVLRPVLGGGDGARRFEYEAQILARLQHPGIAQVISAGVTEHGGARQPYFALEYVRGPSLMKYVEGAADGAALDTDARLRVFLKVCQAVQYAHQNGVIHRDLKPENILVDPHGQPKVVDFGVARVTSTEHEATLRTGAGELLGTLGYMSPEQLSGDPRRVDTRCDVYALGVVLFQLLTGRMPHDLSRRSFPEAVRVVCEEPAQRLGAVRRELRGDLDAIVDRATEKDVSRRYASVSQLAEDVDAFLGGRPVSVRANSAFYHLGKLARRHRALLGVAGAALIVLIAGVLATSWQAVIATRARDAAEAEARKAARVTRFLQSILTAASPNATRGRDVSIREQLERTAARVHDEFADEPDVEAAVRTTIGDTFANLGYYAVADEHLRAALAIRRARLGDDHVDTAATAMSLARVLRDMERFEEALPVCALALATHRARLGAENAVYARNLILYGDVCRRAPNGYREAERAYREGIDLFTQLEGRHSAPVAAALGNLGSLLFDLFRYDEAGQVMKEGQELAREVFGRAHSVAIMNTHNYASFLVARGRAAEAEPLVADTVAAALELYGPQHPETARTLFLLADLALRRDDPLAAEPLARQAFGVRETLLPEDHRLLRFSMLQLADVLARRATPDALDEAEWLLERVAPQCVQVAELIDWSCVLAAGVRGAVLTARGRFEEAEAALCRSYELTVWMRGARSIDARDALNRLILLYDQWRRPELAQAHREALAKLPQR
ncbi:MAG: tetratricopeptide repeat protein [Phycisphaerae bacterium]